MQSVYSYVASCVNFFDFIMFEGWLVKTFFPAPLEKETDHVTPIM